MKTSKKNCKNCETYGKCWMCKFFDKDELTQEERSKIGAGDWRINRAKHTTCEDVITSDNRHDFRYCKCKGLAVDGGSWYLRRVGDIDHCEEMSVKYADVKKEEDGMPDTIPV